MNDITDQTMHELVERLGLEREPFGRGVSGVFFVGGQRRFLVQQVMHALYFAKGIVLLSGADGAGKSRVAAEVCRELEELCDLCCLEASVLMDDNEVRRHLCEKLGLAAEAASDDAALLSALEQLKPDEGDPLPVLLLIDDAQHLAVPVLVRCHTLAMASQGRIRLLLIGDPELLRAWEQAGNLDAEQVDVLPLDAQETADYVATSLQAAGYRGESPLNELQLDALYRESRGNIGAINALAPALLLAATGSPATPPRRKLPLPHVALIALLVVFIGVAALFFGGGGDTDSAGEKNVAAVAVDDGSRQSIPLALPSTDTALPAEVDAQPAAPQAGAPTVSAGAASSALSPPAPAPAPAPSTESKPLPVSAPIPTQSTLPPATKQPATVAPPKPALAAPGAPTKVDAPAKSVSAQNQPATSAPVKSVAAPKGADAAALVAMPSTQFVVQLMAVSKRKALDQFIAKSAGGVKVYSYETRRSGKPWFVAVTGPYADKNAARSAIARLPKALRDNNPWLRSVASVQSDIRNQ